MDTRRWAEYLVSIFFLHTSLTDTAWSFWIGSYRISIFLVRFAHSITAQWKLDKEVDEYLIDSFLRGKLKGCFGGKLFYYWIGIHIYILIDFDKWAKYVISLSLAFSVVIVFLASSALTVSALWILKNQLSMWSVLLILLSVYFLLSLLLEILIKGCWTMTWRLVQCFS